MNEKETGQEKETCWLIEGNDTILSNQGIEWEGQNLHACLQTKKLLASMAQPLLCC